MLLEKEALVRFLVEAKRHTYAAQGDEASVPPVLTGSKQLEYANGDWRYRDIYFGMDFFAGQEVVELAGRPVWTMVYSGGVNMSPASRERTAAVYRFLREALLQVNAHQLYRGPERWREGDWEYRSTSEGRLESFRGSESILLDGESVYELQYSGGLLLD
ncbi:DUF5680 domain-containing protein [Paenibacillus mesotrionivorans]|uniref:DUF5680 domain-containing protein n=1 Tax=Paenibacillus mesotrionivorans TaxID=3160968 RepID=A0ACC7PBJ4_9BACL